MKHHPEQADDEIYMGNSTLEAMHKSSWRTGRLGNQPLTRGGAPLSDSELRPWFIKLSEVQHAIDHARAENKPWAGDIIKSLQPMVDHRSVFTV